MNRERLLFVGVLAIFALWFFVMRAEPEVKHTAASPVAKIDTIPVPGNSSPQRVLPAAPVHPFELVTNERPHPRPLLEDPAPRDLPNIWLPTSISVSVDRYGLLRRAAAAPQEGGGSLELPRPVAAGNGGGGAEQTRERVDEWQSHGRPNKGRVVGFTVNGKRVHEPQELPPVGPVAPGSFHHTLLLLQVDELKAKAEAGVSHVRVQFDLGGSEGGTVSQALGDEITAFRIGAEGKQASWIEGALAWMRMPANARGRHAKGRELLEKGAARNDLVLIEWAFLILGEARKEAQNEQVLKDVLLDMMEAANLLNRQEKVLELAFAHLERFPGQNEVIEYVGNLLASRSFDVLPMAADVFAQAKTSRYAQRRRVEVLVKLGRFAAANEVLQSGRVGSGAEVDLLRARVALALGDLEKARNAARIHTGGESAATAHQIMGGIAYAAGDAAKAATEFMAAATADPGRSTAFSDLGLALAAQGKNADAVKCFDRARDLDSVDNAVIPRLGKAWILLNENKLDEAQLLLQATREANPRDLLVRYLFAYGQERAGDLDAAAKLYRSTLDDDHRYRIAIARLGLVQARRVESGANGDSAKAAVAHLKKAVALNPGDPVLPYVLARFLMTQRIQPQLADTMFANAQKAPSPAQDPDLRFWAQAARAVLKYRDPSQSERTVKAAFTATMEEIKDYLPPGRTERQLMDHPVYLYCRECLDVVQENETKVDKTWTFPSEPRDWNFKRKDPMRVAVNRDRPGVVFSGTIDYAGEKTYAKVLDVCALEYEDKDLNGNTFYEMKVTGSIPENPGVFLGIGLVNKARGRRGPTGVQVRRKPRTGTVEVRLDGGDQGVFKRIKAADYVEMDKAAWPAGKFEFHLTIEGGDAARSKGRFSVHVNGTDVFQEQFGAPSERCSIFGRGRANRPIVIYIWVEGSEGLDIPPIRIEKVVLTKKARN